MSDAQAITRLVQGEEGIARAHATRARLIADLPLPAAAACLDAISNYARTQQRDGDYRPVGQIRTEILTDLVLRPWETSRPAVTAEVNPPF